MGSILIVSGDGELIAWLRSRIGAIPLAKAGSLREAAGLAAGPAGCVVVIDCGVPDSAAEAGWQMLRRRHPEAQLVVVFGPADSGRAIRLGFQAGARCVIPRQSDPHLVWLAIAEALARAGSPPGNDPAPAFNPDPAEVRRSHLLTPREYETLLMLATGASNKQIAARLGLSPKTIRNRVSDILGKLGLESRAQAVVWVRQNLGEVSRRDTPGTGLPA